MIRTMRFLLASLSAIEARYDIPAASHQHRSQRLSQSGNGPSGHGENIQKHSPRHQSRRREQSDFEPEGDLAVHHHRRVSFKLSLQLAVTPHSNDFTFFDIKVEALVVKIMRDNITLSIIPICPNNSIWQVPLPRKFLRVLDGQPNISTTIRRAGVDQQNRR